MTTLPLHSDAFRRRRFLNWFPLGLAYAFLYMGRYNLTVAKTALGDVMTKEDFGEIFAVGTLVYGLAFLLNGPLTDRIGGRIAMLMALFGSAVSNLALALYVGGLEAGGVTDGPQLRLVFTLVYAVNMYFQSFGAVAIVKVNSSWFHVRERGGFSGIFGTMISSGIFFAFTVNAWILEALGKDGGASATKWVFYAPSILLFGMFALELFTLKDRPGQAGHADFDTGDASSGDTGHVPTLALLKRILTNPIILTVALIEFCTGILRQAVMQWYPIYAKEVLALPDMHPMRYGENWLSRWPVILTCFAVAAVFFVIARRAERRRGLYFVSGGLVFLAPFLLAGWGGLLMVAGVIGGNVAGWVSDLFFHSRRAPAAGGLYAILTVATLFMFFSLGGSTTVVGWVGKGAPPPETPQARAAAVERLLPGDRIVAVGGKTEFGNWQDVKRAIACLPATCDGATFDTERCVCSRKPRVAQAADVVVSATLPIQVLRDGAPLLLKVPEPAPKMRAGDKRELKAGPELTMNPLWLGIVVFIISLCVIGTHGLLSGTATMDFGGRRGAATAVGVIDGFVYLGTAVQAFALGKLTTADWAYWPWFMLPFAVIGVLLTARIWHAKPGGAGGH